MKKTIAWRIRHARRKIEEGRRPDKFKRMLDVYKRMRTKEIHGGFHYEHESGDKEMLLPQRWIKVRV